MVRSTVLLFVAVMFAVSVLAQDPDAVATALPGAPVASTSPAVQPASPAFNRDYKPLGVGGKFARFAHNTYSLDIFLGAAATAGIPHFAEIPDMPKAPPDMTPEQEQAYELALMRYERDAQFARRQIQEEARYRGRRFIAGVAEGETRVFLQNFLLPVLSRQDPRYFKAAPGHSAGYRIGYALSRVVVTRSDSGRSTFNYSRVGGAAGAAAAARYFYYDRLEVPQLATREHMLKSIGANLALDAVFNIVREFWPRQSSRE